TMYLVPDFSHLTPQLIVSAMGQAFFSLSLGVCVMTTYGSYLKKETNIPKTAAQVALIDTGVAFIAGLMILPAMFVAKHNGVEIFSASGELLNSDTLVFTVLPAMFDTMGTVGTLIGLVFFLLMVIAALTSSISMLE
ncbi:sodium-dependent transporter, partial [Actinomyces sp. 186855]|nr:sodium-dependent transporter [Actinomyces sp. 186855]